jgi:hypothetical protein
MTIIAITGIAFIISLPLLASTYNENKICEKLYSQAEKNCTKIMCQDFGPQDCPMDGDFQEGLQICVSEGEFESLIKKHNLQNPRRKVKCEDF